MGQGGCRFKCAAPGDSDVNPALSVIMPAFRAERFIAAGISSLLAQTWRDWRLYVIADDEADYEALLARGGLADGRFTFLSTGQTGGGASAARNLALDVISTPYAAVLDADDRFKPDKLARAIAALEDAAIVTFALDVLDESGRRLRTVGEGPDRVLSLAEHKFVNLSMDSMIVWDRRRCDGRYDPGLSNMTDLEFLLQLYRTAPRSRHVGTPVHDYLKVSTSMSNGAGFSAGMIRSKRVLLDRLAAGHYPMADAAGPAGLARFLELSLAAERTYEAALAARPGLLFEDHLEPLLPAS